MQWIAVSTAMAGAVLMTVPPLAAETTRPSNAEILFRMANPCPGSGEMLGTCKGYAIDRVIPIICGGTEAPDNMRWLTLAEAKEKSRWERIGCRRGRKLVIPDGEAVPPEVFPMGDPVPAVEAQPLPRD